MSAIIGEIMSNANAINALCDSFKADDSLRQQMHRLHGELIAHGCSDSAEIQRIVKSRLEREMELGGMGGADGH